MKQIIAIFLIACLNLIPCLVRADSLELTVQKIESEWARIHYKVAEEFQEAAFKKLLTLLQTAQLQYPDQAELIIQEAIIVASNADNIDPISALQAIHQARDLLLRAIKLNPNASEGAAYVTLGSLYYLVPGWPIAYGNDNKAQKLLLKALAINPNTIDANYFYGDFLVSQGMEKEAMAYFNRALAIPVRATQVFADTQLHSHAKVAIIKSSYKVAPSTETISIAFGEK